MAKIFYRCKGENKPSRAVLCNFDESVCDSEILKDTDQYGDYYIELDAQKYDHLYFENGDSSKSARVYTGNLSIGVEYKHNESLERKLTYLFPKNSEKTGRVDNYVFKDEKNLSYREDKSKKVSVFVPSGYDEKTPHDILYFFDAQNLFSHAGHYTDSGDPYGSWQLDVVLDALREQLGKNIIVVAIDNSDKYRGHELFMDYTKFGQVSAWAASMPREEGSHGHLDELADFMLNTVHPFIKSKYCVSEENMGIGGSSMGGIASFYCALRDIGFYKYCLSYSPAYSLYEMSAFKNWFSGKHFSKIENELPKIHIYCGGGDDLEKVLLPSSCEMKQALVDFGYPEGKIFETFDMEKPHNEESWRLILCDSFSKLV